MNYDTEDFNAFLDNYLIDVTFKVIDNAGKTVLKGDMYMLSDYTVGAIIENVMQYMENKNAQGNNC